MEVDHERTEKVVLSLLGSEEEAGSGPSQIVGAWDRLVGTIDDAEHQAGTVVAVTIDGIDRLEDEVGRDTAERISIAVLGILRRSARPTDRVASLGHGHFRALLVPSDDAAATRFVRRVRSAATRRLAAAPLPLALSTGWAHTASPGQLEAAIRLAEERRREHGKPGGRSESAPA